MDTLPQLLCLVLGVCFGYLARIIHEFEKRK